MTKNYKLIPPKQKYMDLPKIYATYGLKMVVAYSCKVVNNMPMGGYVIAVQDNLKGSVADLKSYMKQLKQRFPNKEPFYCISIKEDGITYDNGKGEVKKLPEIVEKKTSELQRNLENIPDEILAKALATVLFTEEELLNQFHNSQK